MSVVKTIYDDLTYAIIGAAMSVHRELGTGFPEEVYQKALLIALTEQNLAAQREVLFTAEFHGQTVGKFYIDIFVDEAVVVELKAVDAFHKKHEQQIIAYLTATGREVGLLFNFGTESLQTKRLFAPQSIQKSRAYQDKLHLWKPAWIANKGKSVPSV